MKNFININQQQAHKIISRFSKAKVLVIGDLMLDEFIWGTVSRISPEAPVPVVLVNRSSFMPGGACNVANNIRSLGGQVNICGVLGRDRTADMLMDELKLRGVNTDGVLTDEARPTIKKTRIIAHHQQVVRVDWEADTPVKEPVLDKIILFIEKTIKDIDAVIIEDYGKGLIQPKLIKHTIKLANRYKKIVAVDPKEEHFSYYKNVTVVTPNQHEAEVGSSVKIKDEPSVSLAGEKLLKKLKCRAALITLGEKGMALFQEGKKYIRIPTVAREVFDVSGAGDTVIACFTLANVSGANMQEAAYISNIAAGVVVGKLGVATVDQKELIAKIKSLQNNPEISGQGV